MTRIRETTGEEKHIPKETELSWLAAFTILFVPWEIFFFCSPLLEYSASLAIGIIFTLFLIGTSVYYVVPIIVYSAIRSGSRQSRFRNYHAAAITAIPLTMYLLFAYDYVLPRAALITSDITFCAPLTEPGKSKCQREAIVNKGRNRELCGKITEKGEKESCYAYFNDFLKREFYKAERFCLPSQCECKKLKAIIESGKNVSSCKTIKHPILRGACYQHLPEYRKKHPNPKKSKSYTGNIPQQIELSPQMCEEHPQARDSCYEVLAGIEKNEDYCEEISDPAIKKRCHDFFDYQ